MKTNLQIEGMHCASCSTLIEKGLKKQDGIQKVSVSLATNTATVDFDEDTTTLASITKKISDLGYKVVDHQSDHAQKAYRKRFIVALILTLPVATTMFVDWMHILGDQVFRFDITILILATIVVAIVGYPFHLGFIKKIKQGQTNMDTLISIGTAVALLYGIYAFIATYVFGTPTHFYHFLEGGSFIITFILLGKYLELKSKGNASKAIQKLMELQVKKARVLIDGQEKEVDVDELKKGDIVVVRSGDKIPIDGEIVKGQSDIDEAMLTGESIPVSKSIGDEAFTGTIVINGTMHIKVNKEPSETVLAKIISVVQQAQAEKPPIQHLVDKIASYFVRAILAIAVVTFFVRYMTSGDVSKAVLTTVSVIVIACPCAMGLATPMAIMVASGTGASKGILIKSGETLEKSEHLDIVVFDKTGTLTAGKPKVTDLLVFDGDEEDLLHKSASLSHYSHHPLSQAVVEYAKQKNIEAEELAGFQEIAGHGLKANGMAVGNKKLLKKENIAIEQEVEQKVALLQEQGKTVNFVMIDGKLAGLIALRDEPKSDSANTIEQLKRMNIESVVVSGDTQKTVEAIAKELGIEKIYAEVLPDGKADIVKQLQEGGKKVAFVGDGINDAPALAQADLGIAMGQGSDIAIETGEMVLVNNAPSKVVEGIKLARKTYAVIRQNLFWAFAYNSILVPVAALGLLLPMYASLAMSLSSVSVVMNSLRLKK